MSHKETQERIKQLLQQAKPSPVAWLDLRFTMLLMMVIDIATIVIIWMS